MSDVSFDMTMNKIKVHQNNSESWRITLVDRGEDSMTGVRLKRVKDYLKDEEVFCFTYVDGLSDVDIIKLLRFHNLHGK
jgi:glucose-1-phosphate cytidylyltransferase